MANAANAIAQDMAAPVAAAEGGMIAESLPFRRVIEHAGLVAPTPATVLIVGESGTGKSRIAAMIHARSGRRNWPFVTVRCAEIPGGLLEGELFGYRGGAREEAVASRAGGFELADRGTLFLDEIGDVPLPLQPRLLRALEEHEFERMGGERTIHVDVRLVAATSRDMKQMIAADQFRADLFYGLNVFPIAIPPLRERPEDIPPLTRHFVHSFAARLKRRIEVIPIEVLDALTAYSWPGNVRELESFIERSVILSRGSVLQAPIEELMAERDTRPPVTLEDAERAHIERTLRQTNGLIDEAAVRLGITRPALSSRMRRLGIAVSWSRRGR
jgi:formate hydrogenlyase transcriptional activator